MGYYTGTIFEIAHPDPATRSAAVAATTMIGRFLGQEVPACGFSIGFERIVDLLAMRDEAAPAPSCSSTTRTSRPRRCSR